MSARKTALHMAAFTLDGQNFLGSYVTTEIDVDIEDDLCSGGATEFEKSEETKRSNTIRFELMAKFGTSAFCHYTNLHVTVLELGASYDVLADVKSFTLSSKIETDEGSGVADFDKFPNAVGRTWTLEINKMVPVGDSAETLMTNMQDTVANRANRVKDVVFTLDDGQAASAGAFSWQAPMRFHKLRHEIARKKIQMFTGSAKLHGAVTAPSSGNTHLLGVAFAGDGLISVVIDSGAGEYTGTGLITECEVGVEDAKVVSIRGTLEIQGALTYAAS